MGLKIDDSKYLRLPRKSRDVLLKGNLPEAYNLRATMPEIGDQGMDGTCVGWSAAYYMRTAMEAGKLKLDNKTAEITAQAFSPSWLYGQIAAGTASGCSEGIFLEDALEVMKTKGSASLACAPGGCENRYGECDRSAGDFKIGDYATLVHPNDPTATSDQRIAAIKSALVESRHAVLIGMLVPPSFLDVVGEHWLPAPGEDPNNAVGAHSMAVIGYDDQNNGGSFLLANSWGKSWGSNGYIWVRYTDLIRFTRNAYQIYSNRITAPTQSIALKGNVEFVSGDMQMGVAPSAPTHAGGKATTSMATYSMSRPYTSGTRFKMLVNNARQSYVYILASDNQNRVTALFPRPARETLTSAMVAANSMVLMPSANASFTLDDVPGEDYFMVFISQKELNLEKFANDIRNAEGDITRKVLAATGEELIPAAHIVYDPEKISYEVKGTPRGSIVPIVVKIVHQ